MRSASARTEGIRRYRSVRLPYMKTSGKQTSVEYFEGLLLKGMFCLMEPAEKHTLEKDLSTERDELEYLQQEKPTKPWLCWYNAVCAPSVV